MKGLVNVLVLGLGDGFRDVCYITNEQISNK